MLIVACQVCGKTGILRGSPEKDGMVRTSWICKHCGTGQVVQVPVSSDARNSDLRDIVLGLPSEWASGNPVDRGNL